MTPALTALSSPAERLYLDANASEPLRPAARAALIAALDRPGNPASVHGDGRVVRGILERARAIVAAHCGTQPQDVVFCSGATEADALAIHGLGAARPILIGATEHDAVRATAPDAAIIPVDSQGLPDLAWLEGSLARLPGALVCLMAANNETGVITPIAPIADLCTKHGALLHVDAAQIIGRGTSDFIALGATSVAISAHKLGGPTGVGALVLAQSHRLAPLIRGGGQEQGRRGGTPHLAGIVGFAAAIQALRPAETTRLAVIRDSIERQSRAVGAIVIAEAAPRLPNTIALALPGLAATTQVIALDLARISVSAGAACSSGKVARSHVLDAMGLHALADCTIRVSLPWNAPDDTAARFLAAYRLLAARALHKPEAFSTSP